MSDEPTTPDLEQLLSRLVRACSRADLDAISGPEERL
jgi:hypothetical protein